MARNYGDNERAFIDGLKEATGRDLAEWMTAITAQDLAHRNDIIDWLRQQGFMFSKASWLERIHHNGGKPIYADAAAARARVRRTPRVIPAPGILPAANDAEPPPQPTPAATAAAPAAPVVPEPPPSPAQADETIAEQEPQRPAAVVELAAAEVPTPSAPAAEATEPPSHPSASALVAASAQPEAASSEAGSEDLTPVLAKAKAYRPLALAVIAKIRAVRPDARFTAHETFISIGAPQPFAYLGITSKELRLHLALGQHAPDDVVRKGAPGGGLGKGETLSHMVVLTDARQIDQRLADLVARAAQNVNG